MVHNICWSIFWLDPLLGPMVLRLIAFCNSRGCRISIAWFSWCPKRDMVGKWWSGKRSRWGLRDQLLGRRIAKLGYRSTYQWKMPELHTKMRQKLMAQSPSWRKQFWTWHLWYHQAPFFQLLKWGTYCRHRWPGSKMVQPQQKSWWVYR